MIFKNKDLESIGLKMHMPNSELAPYIQCYWSANKEVTLLNPVKNKIVSDAGAGVVFNYGSPLNINIGGIAFEEISGCFITGPTINATYLTLKEKVHAIGIRFRPSGAYPFIKKDMGKIKNTIHLLPDNDWNELMFQLKESPPNEMTMLIDNFLLKKLSIGKLDLIKWLSTAIDIIINNGGNIPIDKLCKNMNISRRQFDRNFKKCVGLLPKQLSRIVRINNSRVLIRSFKYSSLAEVAHECGFYDQSHFVNEFKALVETTPKYYSDEKRRMSLFYNQ